MFEASIVSFYVSTATFFLLHCDEWDRVVALPRHKFVTGATLLQLVISSVKPLNNGKFIFKIIPEVISKVQYSSQMYKKS